MDGYLVNTETVPQSEVEALIEQMFGTNITQVYTAWHSHGEMLEVPPLIYFKGDLNDPSSKCGQNSLVMHLLSMTPAGTCSKDGLLSYHLIPDESAKPE